MTSTASDWQKSHETETKHKQGADRSERLKFLIGGVLLLGAVVYLMFSGTMNGAQYFITVDEVVNDSAYVGQTVRTSGAVLGDTINFNAETIELDFTIVHMNPSTGNLAKELYDAVNDTTRQQIRVHMDDTVQPDLLQHEAQAILTGKLGDDGVFYANEVLLKCPSRYDEGVPQQVALNAS